MVVHLPSEDSFDPGEWPVVGHLLRDMKMVAPTPECTSSCSATSANTGFAKVPALLCHMLPLPTVIPGTLFIPWFYSKWNVKRVQMGETGQGRGGGERCELVQICGFARAVFKLTQG